MNPLASPTPPTPALLALADGTWHRGYSCGAPGTAFGEIVFNTSMAGYQEIATDPSYAGQVVCLTYPQQGNYGMSPGASEASRPALSALVVADACRSVLVGSEAGALEYFRRCYGSDVVSLGEFRERLGGSIPA